MHKNHKHLKLFACLTFAVLVLGLSVLSVFAASDNSSIYRYNYNPAGSAYDIGFEVYSSRRMAIHIQPSSYYTLVQTTNDYYWLLSQESPTTGAGVQYSSLTPYALNATGGYSIRGVVSTGEINSDTPHFMPRFESIPFVSNPPRIGDYVLSASPFDSWAGVQSYHVATVHVDYNGGSTSFSYGNTSDDTFKFNCDYFDFYLPNSFDLGLVAPEGKVFRGWRVSLDNYSQIWDTTEEFATPVFSAGVGSDIDLTIKAVWKDSGSVDPPDDPGGDPSDFVSVVRIIDGQFLDRYTFSYGNTIEVCTTPVNIRYYNFGGWFYDAEFTEPVSSHDVVTSDIYIYGKMDYVGPADVDLTELVDTLWSNFYNTFVDLTSNLVIGGVSVITILTVLLLIVLVYLIVKIIKG